MELKEYESDCLKLAHSALDGLDTLLIGILDGDVVAEEIFRKQLLSISDYVEILSIDMGNKTYQNFRRRVEQFNFMLETLDEQGYCNLLIAKITRALCRQVVDSYNTEATNITEEQFFKVLKHINGIEENEEMKSKLLGDLQSLGYKSGLFIPLTENGFMILKEVIGGMLAGREHNDSVEYLNEIIKRCNGLVKYGGIKDLDQETKEEIKHIVKTVEGLIAEEKSKLFSFCGIPLFE